jgi:sugar phosphate permease
VTALDDKISTEAKRSSTESQRTIGSLPWPPDPPPHWRRWLILALGLVSQAATSSFLYGLPYLVPAMRNTQHLSLAAVGLVVAAPTVGLLMTLIAWGAVADRYGERVVMVIGLTGCGLTVPFITVTNSLTGQVILLAIAGAFGSSVNAASGRVVMGWFAKSERGIAMSVRHTAQPLGVAIAGATLPSIAGTGDYRTALVLPAALCIGAAVLVALLVTDPPRPTRRRAGARRVSPYRSPILWRVHGASALLVVPQFAIAAFGMEYLVGQRHWGLAAAGGFLAICQAAGAVGRVGSGIWSDRVGSRLRPMRQLAFAAAGVMLLAALGDFVAPFLVVAAFAVGAVITVADNGLAFTATAEIAGQSWAGRALGVQNTGQNIVAALTPSVFGLIVGFSGYASAFALAAICPLLAINLTPVRHEHDNQSWR